jgi:hypothetical protein
MFDGKYITFGRGGHKKISLDGDGLRAFCQKYQYNFQLSHNSLSNLGKAIMEELQNIPGVGAGKAKRYGEEFLKLIKKHVVENEIDRPEDLRVRTVPNKSKLKRRFNDI